MENQIETSVKIILTALGLEYGKKYVEFQHILGILRDFSKHLDAHPQSWAVWKFLQNSRFLDIAQKPVTGQQNTPVQKSCEIKFYSF